MSECPFCCFYGYLKKNELADRIEAALVQIINDSRTTYYFSDVRFCPLCGKRVDGE